MMYTCIQCHTYSLKINIKMSFICQLQWTRAKNKNKSCGLLVIKNQVFVLILFCKLQRLKMSGNNMKNIIIIITTNLTLELNNGIRRRTFGGWRIWSEIEKNDKPKKKEVPIIFYLYSKLWKDMQGLQICC